MEIQHGSIVDTVIEYASVKFGVELDVDYVSQQLKALPFSQQVKLTNAIKAEDDNTFSDMIDMSAVNESGGTISPTAAAGTPSVAQQRRHDVQQQQDIRRDTNLALKSALRSNPGDRTVAGAQKQATGRTVPQGPDSATQALAGQADANSEQSAANSKEIERLRQLISKGTDRSR